MLVASALAVVLIGVSSGAARRSPAVRLRLIRLKKVEQNLREVFSKEAVGFIPPPCHLSGLTK